MFLISSNNFFGTLIGDFKKALHSNCRESNIISDSLTSSLADAKLACAADNGCGSILETDCDNGKFQLCKSFYKIRSQLSTNDCVHKKLEMHGRLYKGFPRHLVNLCF